MDEILLDIAHDAQRELRREDAGVLPLVLFQYVRLDSAADVRQHKSTHLRRLFGAGRAAMLSGEPLEPLVDGGVQEHGQDRRSGAD